jgi:hypothetical protein
MSQFVLEGRLGVANALVGTFRKDDTSPDQTVIVALLPDDLKPKAERELKEQILLHAQEQFVPWVGGQNERLTGLFNRLNEQQLSFPIKDAGPAADMVAVALDQGKTKNVIYCTNTPAYLAVCSKLGISRQDMASIAELNELLPTPNRIVAPQGAVGVAHKVCEILATGGGRNLYKFPETSPIMAGQHIPVSKGEAQMVIPHINSAVKLLVNPLSAEQFRAKFGQAMEDAAAREKKIYLPYSTCFFETNIQGHRLLFLAKNASDGWWSPYDYKMTKEDFYVTPMMLESNPDAVYVYPYSILFRVENGILQKTRAYLRETDERRNHKPSEAIAQEHIDQGVVRNYSHIMLGLLSTFNSPSHPDQIVEPSEKLRKAREKNIRNDSTRYPFYDYHVITVPNVEDRDESFSTRDNIRAASGLGEDPGGTSGVRQRWHQRSGYFREITHGNGTKEDIFIGDYWAGDARLGIIRKSKKDSSTPSGGDSGPAEPAQ